MSGTKGIAVSQIILLVLGILVLAVVAYLLYTNFVTTGSTISAETCRAEATRICTGCAIAQIDAKSCTYTSKSMADCVTQQRIQGTGSTIDCTVITGTSIVGGSGGAVQTCEQAAPAGTFKSKVAGACPTGTTPVVVTGVGECCK